MTHALRPPHSRFPHSDLARSLMLVGLGVLAVTFALARFNREPVDTWFYSFAWWSYIVIVDAWVYRRRGESLLLSHPRRFLFLALWSIALWFFFEALNFRLQNWHYVHLPSDRLSRWAGYFLAYATVVPGLMETADLVDTAGFLKSVNVAPLHRSGRPLFVGLGLACLALPLLWPQLFFSLIWVALILLLEPLAEILGAPSFLSDWRSGSLRRVSILVVSGFLCGFLWEFWNAFAAAHWVYSVPGMDTWKIFEMPVLGYLGFLPFAVSVHSASSVAVTLWDRSGTGLRWGMGVIWLGFCLAAAAGVDHFTLLKP